MKYLIILLLLVANATAYTLLNRVDCQWKLTEYVGMYKSPAGNYYQFSFGNNYCPYNYVVQ